MTHDWTTGLLRREPPTTFGLWYLVGRGAGAVGVGCINLATGAVLDVWELAVKVRRIFR